MDKTQIKVLLVDDDEDDYILTHDWLDKFPESEFQLDWVDSYTKAIKAIALQQHDVYLVDYRLGNRTGLDLLRAAIAKGCTAPIILLTGQGDHGIDLEAMKAGAADYLEKSQLGAPLLERSLRYAIERQRAAQKIREQAALLDLATDAILVRDLENQIIFWNRGAELLYGCQKEQAIGKNASRLWQEKDLHLFPAALSTLITQGSWQGELQQITSSGQEIIVESRWTLIHDFAAKPQAILVVNTDITQKKQLEAQFLRAQRLESLGTLASGIAHDLNNILAPILMTAQLLESQLDDARSHRLLSILIANVKRGANLVKQVLSFARGMEGERTLLQVRHIITEIRHIIKETFPKSIEVETILAPDMLAVLGDATQLHQVLMNLCVNARDAMPDGGTLTISGENLEVDENYAQMHLDAEVGLYIVITVADTGIGIERNVAERMFEPFFTTKEIGKGTGLGLSTVLGIVKSHNGFIDVDSQVGKGSQFKVYLPAVAAKVVSEAEPEEFLAGNGESILVVDDEAAIRDITKTTLETYNYLALTANDGIEAIAVYAEHQGEISIVLTDMVMPFMDGLTTIRTLRKINPDVKIIAVSGLSSQEKFSAADVHVHAFLSKPYTAKELLQTINEVKNS